jgi:hypothetical protein
MTDVRAVPGEMKDPGEGSRGDDCGASMSSAGLGKVLNVEPRDVYLLVCWVG